MEHVHMTEAEVTANFAAVFEKLRQGAAVVVEHDSWPIVTPLNSSARD
jgi:hypothetical protein